MLLAKSWQWLAIGCIVGTARSVVVPIPAITPAPQVGDIPLHEMIKRQSLDAAAIAEIMLTALPQSLRMLAATNIPAVSSILWHDFLDNNKPEWFLDLPQDVQDYLVREYGPSTAWPTSTASVSSSSSNMASTTDVSSSPTSSATSQPDSDGSGLTKHQKLGIGIGVGVPLGLLMVAALLFGCCFLMRRRRRKHYEGSEPPSSPGFIPRFSFHDKHTHSGHRAPLNARSYSGQSLGTVAWDDDGYDPGEWGTMQRSNNAHPTPVPMAMHDSNPIMAPPLYHTHTSNRARGTRTSYTSLRSVAEVTEPEERTREPVFENGDQTPPVRGQTLRRLSQPLHMDVPLVLAAPPVPRKPVAADVNNGSPAAQAASRSLKRPSLTGFNNVNNRHSSSSGAVRSSVSSSLVSGNSTDNSTPFSPVSDHSPKNPFLSNGEYIEDYGPEYSNEGHVSHEDGALGGHRSLDQYPTTPTHSRKNSKTEWPLLNMPGPSTKRNKSPQWDRVYAS